jgi:hypothetical protein
MSIINDIDNRLKNSEYEFDDMVTTKKHLRKLRRLLHGEDASNQGSI